MHDVHARAAQAYLNRGNACVDQRQLEANVLLKAANRLEEVRRQWGERGPSGLEEALLYNRKLWTIFAAEMADGAGRLPEDLRNNVGSLAVFIFKRTFELLGRPEAAKVDALVDINRSIAAGLAARPQPPHQTEPGAPVPPSASGVA